ncbi:MAG: basic amino acid ABC transporter substrate-binding protein [Thermodesulfobacteriota bacterium]
MAKRTGLLMLVFLLLFLPACGDEGAPPQSGKTTPPAAAESPFILVFAVDATWPPMEYLDEKGRIVGFSIDYMTAAAREAGFKPVFQNVAWEGIFEGLDRGDYDAVCSSVSITQERRGRMDFSEPYFRVRQALLVRRDSAARRIEDLVGGKVGAQVNTTGAEAVKGAKGVGCVTYPEVGPAVEDLVAGKLEGVVCDDPVAANYALVQGKYQDLLKVVAMVETKEVEYYGIAVKKHNQRVLDLVNQGLAGVKAKGLDRELLAKWVGQ